VNTFAGPAGPSAGANTVSPWLVLLLATACGFIAANMYYAQPLAGPISAALGFSQGTTGLIVTMTQVGCGMGMLLVVPLGDLFENRRLALILLGIIAIASLGAALAFNPLSFLIAAWFIGLGTVAVHVLVPYAAHMAPEAVRGRVVGNVMSGLLMGIMLARPVASFVASLWGWHAIYLLSAAVMAALAVLLLFILPSRRPEAKLPYAKLLANQVRTRFATDWGLSETGATGPTGNRYGDAAGHSCMAVAGPQNAVFTLETGSADRQENMQAFANTALELLLANLSK